jgi:hypothetical protein
LVRELATVGIKVEHFFEDTKAESTALDVSTEIPMDLDEIINVAT